MNKISFLRTYSCVWCKSFSLEYNPSVYNPSFFPAAVITARSVCWFTAYLLSSPSLSFSWLRNFLQSFKTNDILLKKSGYVPFAKSYSIGLCNRYSSYKLLTSQCHAKGHWGRNTQVATNGWTQLMTSKPPNRPQKLTYLYFRSKIT